MNLPKVPHDFVIRHVSSRVYFREMREGKPHYDLGLLDAAKFKSLEEARAQVKKFPAVAQVMCDVVPRRK